MRPLIRAAGKSRLEAATAPSSNRPGDAKSRDAPLPAAAPPYITGRVEFYGVFADLARGKRNWQIAAFVSLGVSATLGMGLATVAAQSRVVPYVVEVDRLGEARAFGPAERLRSTDQRVIVRDVAGFVRDVRSVLGDPLAQRDMVTRAFAFVDRGAAGFLNAYFADPEHDPRRLGRELTRLVEITSVLPVPGTTSREDSTAAQTWKVSWIERATPRSAGGLPTEAAWEGYFATRVIPPTRVDERLTLNPLGVYIIQLHWTQVAGQPISQGATLGTAAVEPPSSGRRSESPGARPNRSALDTSP